MLDRVKKIALSVSVVVLFVLYGVQERLAPEQDQTVSRARPPDVSPASATRSEASSRAAAVTPASTASLVAAVTKETDGESLSPVTAPTASADPGGYVDGVYTGDVVDARWGDILVQVVVRGGTIADIYVPVYPDHRDRSGEISRYAIGKLATEVIAVHSADVDVISGATDTSAGFLDWLESALREARR